MHGSRVRGHLVVRGVQRRHGKTEGNPGRRRGLGYHRKMSCRARWWRGVTSGGPSVKIRSAPQQSWSHACLQLCGGSDVSGATFCCCGFASVPPSGGIERNTTRPHTSSENSVPLLSKVRRIPSAERSRGTWLKAQFTCSTAVLDGPCIGTRRIRNTARPPVGTGAESIGKRL